MTIHSSHPFLPADGERNQVRRLRGRLPLPVSLWTAVDDGRPVGWTVSSMMVADGEPAQVLGLVDEDSDLADAARRSRTVAISLLGGPHRALADAFAGLAPAPGGVFRLGSWTDTPWGPVLDDAVGWVGARLLPGEPGHAGWALLVRATVERVEVVDEPADGILGHLRGRYVRLDG